MTSTTRTVQQVAADLLSRRDHSYYELQIKLQQRDFDLDEIHTTLDHFVQKGWLNEARFVESYMLYRARRGYGPLRIRQELQEKRVGDDLIDAMFAETDIDWDEQLLQVYRKKFGVAPVEDYTERAKQQRFLQYRGFYAESIRRLIE